MASRTPILSLTDVAAGYADNPAGVFDPLNVSLRAGELVCLLGPNGAGKSTLLRTIAGLQQPLRGKIIFHNAALADYTRIAVVLTDAVRVPGMTVYELTALGRYPWLGWDIVLSGEDDRIILESITRAGAGDLVHRKIDELSDGQRQMVMIARALAQDTPALLLDEPTAHLDPGNRIAIMRLLKSLAAESGKAILMATHELDLALQTADMLWLASARTIVRGVPEDLVLKGAIEKLFNFDGFDLISGRIRHSGTGRAVTLVCGDESYLRWTRSALERCGYTVGNSGERTITVEPGHNPAWVYQQHSYGSIEALLDRLQHAD